MKLPLILSILIILSVPPAFAQAEDNVWGFLEQTINTIFSNNEPDTGALSKVSHEQNKQPIPDTYTQEELNIALTEIEITYQDQKLPPKLQNLVDGYSEDRKTRIVITSDTDSPGKSVDEPTFIGKFIKHERDCLDNPYLPRFDADNDKFREVMCYYFEFLNIEDGIHAFIVNGEIKAAVQLFDFKNGKTSYQNYMENLWLCEKYTCGLWNDDGDYILEDGEWTDYYLEAQVYSKSIKPGIKSMFCGGNPIWGSGVTTDGRRICDVGWSYDRHGI